MNHSTRPTSPTHKQAPVLETDRLLLRGHQLADLPACSAMWADPIVVKYIGGKPSTEQEAWSRIMRYTGHWALLGFGYWAVEEKSSGKFVGELGFANFKRAIKPSLGDIPEAGWIFSPAFHGKGFAHEALTATMAWGEKTFQWPGTVCIITEGNTASIKLAEKVGYTELRRTTYEGDPTIVFSRQSSERG